MSERELLLKISLKDDGFKVGIVKAQREAEKGAKAAGNAWSQALSNGVKGGMTALQGFAGQARRALSGIAGIAGGIGLGALVDSAVKAQTKFRQLAFALRATGDQRASVESVKREVQSLALATGQTSEDVADSFAELANRLGSVQEARDAMKAMAEASTASGVSMRALTDVMEAANQQFGITGKQAGDVFATIIEMGRTSGLSVEEVSARFEQVAASARAAGLEGEAGFKTTVALVRQADQSFGGLRKGLPALLGLFDQLGSKADKASIFAKLGIDAKKAQGGAVDAIREIISATGGKRDKLEKALGTGQAKLLVDLAADFSKTFDKTKGSVKEKTAAALRAFDEGLSKAGKGALAWGDVQKEASAALRDPAKQIELGIERLKVAFTKPEVIAGMTKLAALLPKVATALAKLVGFAAENPATALAVAGGGVFAKGAIEAMIMGGMTRGAAQAATSLEGGMARGGASAGQAHALALAAVTVAWIAAADQGAKLMREVGAKTIGEFPAKMREAMREAAKLNREHELAQFEQGAGPEGERAVKNFWGQEYFEREYRDAQGKVQVGTFETRQARGGATGAFSNIASDAEAIERMVRQTGRVQAPGGAFAGTAGNPGNVSLSEVKIKEQQPAAVGRAMAQQLRGQELRVRVVNADELKGGGIAPTAPSPGSAPRP